MEKLTKICTKCGTEKSIDEFNKSNRTKDGKNNHCKQCTRDYMNSKREIYKDNQKKYYEENKEQISKQKKERYQKDKDIIKAQVKKYRDTNKDKILERNRRYRANNKEKVALKQKIYHRQKYLENARKILERNKEYRLKNIEKSKAYHRRYRNTPKGKAIQRNAQSIRRIRRIEGDVTTEQMIELQKTKFCYWCNEKIKKNDLNVDHYIPISKGGKHTISNLVASCSKCNLQKRAKDPQEYANSIGKLL